MAKRARAKAKSNIGVPHSQTTGPLSLLRPADWLKSRTLPQHHFYQTGNEVASWVAFIFITCKEIENSVRGNTLLHIFQMISGVRITFQITSCLI
jgi:hypothetical protein